MLISPCNKIIQTSSQVNKSNLIVGRCFSKDGFEVNLIVTPAGKELGIKGVYIL